MPTNVVASSIEYQYEQWTKTYLQQPATGQYYVAAKGDNIIYSKNIGYGLLLTAYAGDKTHFDGLWEFYMAHISSTNGLMYAEMDKNLTPSTSFSDPGADIDAAMALLIADKQWPNGTYLEDARELLKAIKLNDFNQYRIIWNNYLTDQSDVYIPGNQSPAFYRHFAIAAPKDSVFWLSAANEASDFLLTIRNENNGLVSEAVEVKKPIGLPENSAVEFNERASRNPIQMCVDLLWHGDNACEASSDISEKLSAFCGTDLDQIRGPIAYNATKPYSGPFPSPIFKTIALSKMVDSVPDENSINKLYTITQIPGDDVFNQTTMMLMLFIESGNFWNPNPPASTMLFDAEGNNKPGIGGISNFGTLLYSFNDSQFGGTSYISPQPNSAPFEMAANGANGTDSCLKVSYSINIGNSELSQGQVGIGFNVNIPDADNNYKITPLGEQASNATAITFSHKGKALSCILTMQNPPCSNEEYQYEFQIAESGSWSHHRLLFDTIKLPTYSNCSNPTAFDIKDVIKIEFVRRADNGDTSVFYIDEVAFEGVELDLSNRFADKSALKATIETAQELLQNKNPSNEIGGYLPSTINRLQQAVDSAEFIDTRYEISQAEVDTEVQKLSDEITLFKNSAIEKNTLLFDANNANSSNQDYIISELGTAFYTYDDQKDGGKSTIGILKEATESDSLLKAQYVLDNVSPFVGFGFNLDITNEFDTVASPIGQDAEGSTGISLYHKGKAVSMQLVMNTDVCPDKENIYYTLEIPEHYNLEAVDIKWDDITIPDWAECSNPQSFDITKLTHVNFTISRENAESGKIYINKIKLEGINLDLSGRIANRQALKDSMLIAKDLAENAEVGNENGQYLKKDIDEFDVARLSADSAYFSVEITQAAIDSALQKLSDAIAEFRSAKIEITSLDQLNEKISVAESLYTQAEKGDKKGQYNQDVYDDFKQTIDSSKAIAQSQAPSSSEIEEAISRLNSQIEWFNASKNQYTAPKGMNLLNESLSISINDTINLQVEVVDEEGLTTDVLQDVYITVIDGENIDSLSSNQIIGKAEGSIKIRISSVMDKAIAIDTSIVVNKIAAESISASPCQIAMKIGETYAEPVRVSIQPENATVQTWDYSASSGISLNDDLYLSASEAGEQTITYIAEDDTTKQQECTITVSLYPPTKIIASNKSYLKGSDQADLEFIADFGTEVSSYKDSSFIFINDNEDLLTVSETGKITFSPEITGTANIIIQYENDNSIADTATVTVTENKLAVVSVQFDSSELTLTAGETYQFQTSVLGENGETPTNSNLIYESLNKTIATISTEGKLWAVAEGESTIIVKSEEDTTITDTCTVTVLPLTITQIIIEQGAAITLTEGDTLTLKYRYEPELADDDITFETKNSTSQVTAKGLVTALKAGSDTIKVYSAAKPDVFKEIIITVNAKAKVIESIKLPENITVNMGETSYDIDPIEVLPIGSDPAEISFYITEGEEYAQINSITGLLTATDITESPIVKVMAKTSEGTVTSNVCIVQFTPSVLEVESVTLDAPSGSSKKTGDKGSLSYTIFPDEATIYKKSFFSSEPAYISIDENGAWEVISQPAMGEGEISVKVGIEINQLLTDTVTILVQESEQVLPDPQSMSIMPFVGLKVNDEYQYSVSFEPEGSSAEVVWKSTNTAIASVKDGSVTALAEGTVKIIAFSPATGLTAYSLLTVAENEVAAEDISLPQKLTLTKGSSSMIQALVLPMNATSKEIRWTSSDTKIAIVSNMGIVKAVGEGTAEITAQLANQVYSVCSLTVTLSNPPQKVFIPKFSVQSGTSLTIDLSEYLQDDETAAEDMGISIKGADSVAASVSGTEITITPQNDAFEGTERLILIVTDSEGQSVEIPFAVSFINKADEAPEIGLSEINIDKTDNNSELTLSDIVEDDFTQSDDISWDVEDSEHFSASIKDDQLIVEAKDETVQATDTITITATDNERNTTSKQVVVSNIPKENKAPQISAIPEQTTESMVFLPINLNKYVTDDYTQPNDIIWTAEKSMKVSVTIINNACFAQMADNSWTGTEMLTFTATDEEGLNSSIEIAFSQNHPSEGVWTGLPNINFTANRYKTTPSGSVQLYADVMGADALKWTVDGSEIDDAYISNPRVKFNNPGLYKVKLLAQNDNGTDYLLREEYITVYGITTPNSTLCKGDELELKAFGKGSFAWSTGSDSKTAVITGDKTTSYWLTITDGIVEMTDSVNITVPAVAYLGKDFDLCDGEVYPLKLQNEFESYKWTLTEESTEATVTASKKGKYAVEVVDSFGCISHDTLEVQNIFDLPSPAISFEDSICLGETAVLTAEADLAYKWNTSENTRSISVTEAGSYTVTVTDLNRCSNSKTIQLTVLEPHKEKLGLATFSEDGQSVVLAWRPTQDKRTAYYEIMKEVGVGEYESIHQSFVGDSTYYVDRDANVKQQEYKYLLRTHDSVCNNYVDSDPHRTMHLSKLLTIETNEVSLQWKNYIGLPVSKYHVMKLSDGVWSEIGRVVPQDTSEINQFSDLKYKKGDNYRIEFALEGKYVISQLKTDSGPYSYSISNIAEVELTGVMESSIELTLYPVPVSESLVIDPEFNGNYLVEIYSTDGTLIKQQKASGKTAVSMAEILNGTYLIKISTKNGSAQQMFIKR